MIQILKWDRLNFDARKQILMRPAMMINEKITMQVNDIIMTVKNEGDKAVKDYTKRFDDIELDEFRVSLNEFEEARVQVCANKLQAIEFAYHQILRCHETQRFQYHQTEISPGVYHSRQARAMTRVGLYVPAGTVPLPSTVLMLGIPALIAGCEQRVMCTPPRKDGTIDPYSLVAAELCGINEIYKIGGAQAIAAMGYGTQSIVPVNKIFGPGNAWVTAAKLAVMADMHGAHCDLPAGPSELVVIADKFADAKFIAADLLAQAEHSQDAQVLLITDSEQLANQVLGEIEAQVKKLLRREIIQKALTFAKIIIVDNLSSAFDISNEYAPEHLSLQVTEPDRWLSNIDHAGTVFMGGWTAQALGDYVIGTNHVLPTYGFSKVCSGLCVNDFMKIINFAKVSVEGLKAIGEQAITLADIEKLDAHKNAVAIRLEEIT